MVCIINPSYELTYTLDYYSMVLGSEDAAYYVLSLNNGYPLYYTPFGEHSKLYEDLAQLYGSDEAIRIKSSFYTQRFIDAHGDWTRGEINNPGEFDQNGEPLLEAQSDIFNNELSDIFNFLFLKDDYSKISDIEQTAPDSKSYSYAVEEMLKMSYDQYIDQETERFLSENLNPTEELKAENIIVSSRNWYDKKVNSIMNEQVRALCNAFGLKYITRPNGSIELSTINRNIHNGKQELRIKFVNSIIHDPLEDLLSLLTGGRYLADQNTLKVLGSVEYIHDAIVRRRSNDRMLAANTLITVGLVGGTSTTINKSLAYHYITMFLDTPLILAGLAAVNDEAVGGVRSLIYLVNKLVEAITSPSVVGVQDTSYVAKAYNKIKKQGYTYVEQELLNFWEEFDNLIHEIITNGVKSELAKKKILSVVAAAFLLNDDYWVYGTGSIFTQDVNSALDYYSDWYSTKYKPWGLQTLDTADEIVQFLNSLETYYENKITREERLSSDNTANHIRLIQNLLNLKAIDKESIINLHKILKDLLNLAYLEIRDAIITLDTLQSNNSVDNKTALLGEMYNNTIAFYNYIINNALLYIFESNEAKMKLLSVGYSRVKDLLSNLNSKYKNKLYKTVCEFTDLWIDNNMSKDLTTEEMRRRAKENVHKELKHDTVYGDVSGLLLWVGMRSLSESHIVRIVQNAILKLNETRNEDVLAVCLPLLESLKAAKKAIGKDGISGLGYRFTPNNFLMVYMERDKNGVPTGMFIRKHNYGNFFLMRKLRNDEIIKDIEKQIQDITGNLYYKLDRDSLGNPIFPEGQEWDKYADQYDLQMNEFECEYGHKRFLKEYYDIRIQTMSRTTRRMLDEILDRINSILKPVTEIIYDDSGKPYSVPHLERLSVEDYADLLDLQKQLDNLSNEYTILGVKKTGDQLKAAQQIKSFREKIKGRIKYRTDQNKYDLAKRNITDSQELSDFEKRSTNVDINPRYWEIYNVLKKEYEELFPDYLKSSLELLNKLYHELQDIVNTVKRLRFLRDPDLRSLTDAAWVRLKLLDKEIENAYLPIKEWKKQQEANGIDVIPSPFQLIGNLQGVKDRINDEEYLYDQLIKEAKHKDELDSADLGYVVHDAEIAAYDKYSKIIMTNLGSMRVPLSVFSYLIPSEFPEEIKERFEISDDFEYILNVPNNAYNEVVTDAYSYDEDVDPLYDPEFDPNEGNYLQPKELNPAYEWLTTKAPKEVFELYLRLLDVKKLANDGIPYISQQSLYKLPQMRASTCALLSRTFFNGSLETLKECVTNQFIANETDTEILDDFTTLPDGTRVNNVPLRFIENLLNPGFITSDIVGAIVLYYHMAANYKYKQAAAPLFHSILRLVGSDSYLKTLSGTSHLILGKTTNRYEELKNVIDNLLYEQKLLLGERGSLRMKTKQKTIIKNTKLAAKIGTLTALSRNTFSQLTGFTDARGKLVSFAFSGEAFNLKDLTYAVITVGANLPLMISNTGDILSNNKISALMIKNNLSSTFEHMTQGSHKSQIRRIMSMESAGMAGFRISDYIINATCLVAIYNNYRLLDGEFLSEREFKNRLKRQGFSRKNINSLYGSAITLYDAYTYNYGIPLLRQSSHNELTFNAEGFNYDNLSQLEHKIAILLKTWVPKFNGAVAEDDKALIQQNVFANFTVAMRSYLINEAHTRFFNGYDFVDPNTSKSKIAFLKSKRKSLVQAYKLQIPKYKRETMYQKLVAKRKQLVDELYTLLSSGDIKVPSWNKIKTLLLTSGAAASAGAFLGSVFGLEGTLIGGTIGGVVGFISGKSMIKGKNPDQVNVFVSKIRELENKISKIDAKLYTINSSDDRDVLLRLIQDINDKIIEMENDINENQGLYDYARNLYCNGSNRLAGRLLMNINKKFWNWANVTFRPNYKNLNGRYSPKITENQVIALKRIAYDVIHISVWYLAATFTLSMVRYGDGRQFLGGAFNDLTTKVMKKIDTGLKEDVLRPVMESDIHKDFWNTIHESSTEGALSNVYLLNKMFEQKADAMLGYNKKTSRKDLSVSRVQVDPVERQAIYLEHFYALLALKTLTEGVTPYDPQTVNDLMNAISATLNVTGKGFESSIKLAADYENGTYNNPLQGGPYNAYFNKAEHGFAHSLFRPFGFPSAYELSTTAGLITRENYLANLGINTLIIPRKETTKSSKSQNVTKKGKQKKTKIKRGNNKRKGNKKRSKNSKK